MGMDLWFALGGGVGTFLRQLMSERDTWSKGTLVDVILGAGGMVLGYALGLVPEDLMKALAGNPVRVIAFSGVAAYAGVDFIRLIVARINPTLNT